MVRSDRALSVSWRVYRVLLTAYPREFRREYGRQMEQAFRDLCREERRKGERGDLVRLWVRTILDLGTTAFVQRINALGRGVGVNDYRLAGIGVAFLAAPLFFVAASLLKYELGIGFLFDPLDRALMSDPGRLQVFNLISPVVFLGGLGLALVLNVYAVLGLNVSREDGTIVSTVRVEPKFWNLAVALLSVLLLGTLVGYFFLENFAYRP
jgi:hypothetical protein